MWSALDADWRRVATGSTGRAALRRWSSEEPVLEGAFSSHDVLAMCRQGGDEGGPALTALLRLAGADDFAQQTVLQVILPGLVSLSRRVRWAADDDARRWANGDELEQEVAATGYERIRALAGTTQPWAARTLLDTTWRRLRSILDDEGRHRARFQPLWPSAEIESPADRSPAEHVAQLVIDAVGDGRLDQSGAQLFYARRVLGDSLNSLVPVSGLSRWTLRERIAGSAQVLADAS